MKVALINDYLENTGIGNYAFSLQRELENSNEIESEMIYLKTKENEEEMNSLIHNYSLRILNQGIKLPFFNKTLNNNYYFPKKIPKEYDLFHAGNQFLAKIAKYNKPCIVSCMDIIPIMLKSDYPLSLRIMLDKAMKNMREAEKIITISDYTKYDIIKQYKLPEEKIKTVYLGYDKDVFKIREKKEARYKLKLPEKAKIILHVGSEEPRKNLKVIFNAIPELKKEFKNLIFVRVGRESRESKKIIQKLGIGKEVIYFSGIGKEKLALFYNACDIFVFPSYYEGFGLPVLEAMASGIPVVTANATSIPEITGENGAILVKPKEEGEWKEQIKNVLYSESLQKKLIENGKARSKAFGWERVAGETKEVYGEVLE